MAAPPPDPEVEGFLSLLAATRAPRTVEAYRRDLNDLRARLGKRLGMEKSEIVRVTRAGPNSLAGEAIVQ